jgi:hypothetical protein
MLGHGRQTSDVYYKSHEDEMRKAIEWLELDSASVVDRDTRSTLASTERQAG